MRNGSDMETKSTFQFMRFNVHGYGTTISTSAGAESSVYTLDFTPKTANVYVIWTLTCTYPLNNGVVQAWGDIASGPANSRQSSSQHSHTASTRIASVDPVCRYWTHSGTALHRANSMERRGRNAAIYDGRR